jgi:hypothetical protein
MLEAIMFNRTLKTVALGAFVLAPIFAAGCSSSSQPYSVTGNDQAEIHERLKWTDDKGHYHPEWRDGVNRPAAYPKNIPD